MTEEDGDFGYLRKLMMTRRAIREFTDKHVSERDLVDVLKTALWAPSASNMQARYFVVVRDPAILRKIKAFAPGIFSLPSCLVVLCTDKKKALEAGGEHGRDRSSLIDISVSAQNILLSAWAKGIGTCPVASFNADAVSKIIGLPAHVFPELLITMGYPAGMPEAPARPDWREVIFFDHFGNRRDQE
jgi:nitroreductase